MKPKYNSPEDYFYDGQSSNQVRAAIIKALESDDFKRLASRTSVLPSGITVTSARIWEKEFEESFKTDENLAKVFTKVFMAKRKHSGEEAHKMLLDMIDAGPCALWADRLYIDLFKIPVTKKNREKYIQGLLELRSNIANPFSKSWNKEALNESRNFVQQKIQSYIPWFLTQSEEIKLGIVGTLKEMSIKLKDRVKSLFSKNKSAPVIFSKSYLINRAINKTANDTIVNKPMPALKMR